MPAQPIRLGCDHMTNRELFSLSVDRVEELGRGVRRDDAFLTEAYCSSPMRWTTTDRVCGTRRCSHT